MTAAQDSRAQFEAQFKHLDLTQEPDAWGQPKYKHDAISLAWEAWQASRAALSAEPVAVPKIEFGMRGKNMTFQIGNQRFTLAYEPEEDGEFDFMASMLTHAISAITHGVKMDSAAAPQPEAQDRATAMQSNRQARDDVRRDLDAGASYGGSA